jgi:hypothetical protein
MCERFVAADDVGLMGLSDLAEARIRPRLAAAELFDVPVLLRHRQVVPGIKKWRRVLAWCAGITSPPGD